MTSQLEEILAESKEEQLVALAQSLLNYLENQAAQVVPHDPSLLEKLQSIWNRLESGWLTRSKMKVILIIGLGLWAGWALTSQTGMFLATHNAQQFSILVQQFIANRLIRNASGMNWFEAQLLLEGTMGFFALIAVIFYLCGKDKIATTIGILDLVVTLAVVNLITFYFDQFSTIAYAIYQFVLLVFLLLYRRRFLARRIVKHHQSKKV
jgi:hypothetical protein